MEKSPKTCDGEPRLESSPFATGKVLQENRWYLTISLTTNAI